MHEKHEKEPNVHVSGNKFPIKIPLFNHCNRSGLVRSVVFSVLQLNFRFEKFSDRIESNELNSQIEPT